MEEPWVIGASFNAMITLWDRDCSLLLWGNRSSESVCDLPSVTQLVSGRVWGFLFLPHRSPWLSCSSSRFRYTWRVLFPAAPWAPCDKELSLCFPQVCGEAPQKLQFFLSPCIQNRGQLGFIMITLEVVKIPKESFITDMELAAFFHKQCIGGMSCFGEEETFLEDKDDRGEVGRARGRVFRRSWLSFLLLFSLRGLCLPSPGREERHWLISQICSSVKKETTGLKWSHLC